MAIIRTPRLVLRPFEPTDWEAFRSVVQDDDLMRHMDGALTPEAARAVFDRLILNDVSTAILGWALLFGSQGTYCGHVFLKTYQEDSESLELGFVLLKRFHGHGLAVEAAAAARSYARTDLHCRTVYATVDEDNEPSRAVLARVGMTEVARGREDGVAYMVYSDAQ